MQLLTKKNFIRQFISWFQFFFFFCPLVSRIHSSNLISHLLISSKTFFNKAMARNTKFNKYNNKRLSEGSKNVHITSPCPALIFHLPWVSVLKEESKEIPATSFAFVSVLHNMASSITTQMHFAKRENKKKRTIFFLYIYK